MHAAALLSAVELLRRPRRLRSGRPIAARFLAALRAAPPGRQISRRKRVLRRARGGKRESRTVRGICRGSGVLGPKMLVEIIVEHLGARLRSMSDRDRGLRPDAASVGLSPAE